jgi:hypothetical protein
LGGYNRKLDPAFHDIKYGIGRIPLREKNLMFLALQRRSAFTGSREKVMGSKGISCVNSSPGLQRGLSIAVCGAKFP